MKKDQYLQHDVTAVNNTKIMRLVHYEQMEGYGIYWRLLEHLRGQEQYTDSLEIVEILAKGMNVATEKVMHIIKDYGLFTVQNNCFSSPGLRGRMEKLDEARERKSASGKKGGYAKARKDKALQMAGTAMAVEESRAEESKAEKSNIIIRDDNPVTADAAAVGIRGNWEKCIDDLAREQVWCELMAMRSELKEDFTKYYPHIIRAFKNHVRSYGKEAAIFTLSDAKNYFSNYVSPGKPPHAKLVEMIARLKAKDPYRYEERNAKGERSYCGLPIPDEAPPRPSGNALWNGKDWE